MTDPGMPTNLALMRYFRQRVLDCCIDLADSSRRMDLDPRGVPATTAAVMLELSINMVADLTTMPKELLLEQCARLFDEAKAGKKEETL